MNMLGNHIVRAAGCCLLGVSGVQAQDPEPLPPRTAPFHEYVVTWPDAVSNKVSKKLPLKFEDWDKPYGDAGGKGEVERINAWFKEGAAAGLSQDTFRSFDSNHSKVGAVYPQMTMAKPVADYREIGKTIFADRVTFGVQSLGFHQSVFDEPMAIVEFHDRCQILSQVKPSHLQRKIGVDRAVVDTTFYRALYEANTLLICPAVWNYQIRQNGSHFDNVSFLSPFFLYSLGQSGSDSYLMKPILYAAAALPPEVKTRMLRTGTYVPSLLGLFKTQLGQGSLLNEAAHPSAYALPEIGNFLSELVDRAHAISHIPPVTRLRVLGGGPKSKVGYAEDHRYLVKAALEKGQTLTLELDLDESWTDAGQELTKFEGKILREPDGAETLKAELKKLLLEFTERHPLVEQTRARLKNAESQQSSLTKIGKSCWRLEVPWQGMATGTGLKRTDVVFVASDGSYLGAPAYVSVRHLQPSDRWLTE